MPIGLSQGRVSTHLACLADCGYVQPRRDGRRVYYRVADPRVAGIVMLAQALAADNHAARAPAATSSDAHQHLDRPTEMLLQDLSSAMQADRV
nr:ArsR family transcriptional regulator [Jiangella muralis]